MESQDITKYVMSRSAEIGNKWADIAAELNDMGVEITRKAVQKRYLANRDKPITETREERVQAQKDLLLSRQIEAIDRADIQSEARFQLLLDTLKDSITPLEFSMPEKVDYGKPIDVDEEAVGVLLSDIHLGKRTRRYNIAIAEDSFRTICRGIMTVVNIHRKAYPIKHLHLFWAGDIVDGDSIFPTQSHHADGHMVNQIFGAMPGFVEELGKLATQFETVTCHCVRGNHGRVSKTSHEESNWDNIFYQAMKLATVNVPNIIWDIPLDWKGTTVVNGTKFLYYHGHQIKMQLNLPWYGITTRVSRWSSTKELSNFDVTLQGHFHSSSCLRWNDKKIMTNGTLVDDDEFALEFIGMESSRSQWCFGIHPKRKVTWCYELTV